MAYFRNRFVDPSDGRIYEWQVNHFEEQSNGKQRSIEHGGLNAGVGLVRQQGEDSPATLTYAGTILHAAQLQEMLLWWQKTQDHTVFFRDFTGAEYEVLITAFDPVRRWTARNPRDASIPLHYWTYTITMEVVDFVTGPWADAGVTP